MNKEQILGINYALYKNPKITNRTFNFSLINDLIEKDYVELNWQTIGYSFETRLIRMLKIGEGKTKILLWSQMHGDEPTATAAIFDLINYLQSGESQYLLKHLSIYFIPVINPDGLENFTRRNAQQIDINRDYLVLQSPEANVLKSIKSVIKPDFAFNLHDQSSLYCTSQNKPVGISLLAPATDIHLTINWSRKKAMKLIVSINYTLQELIPNHVARFKDEYEARAFGDNFQKTTPTILIESGNLSGDEERQFIRELNFYAIITAFEAIVDSGYQENDVINYLMIPLQSQEMFHIKLTNCKIETGDKSYTVDLGLNYTEIFDTTSRTLKKCFTLTNVGDLSTQNAYVVIDSSEFLFNGSLMLNHPAEIELRNEHAQIVFEWKYGLRI
ncbi:DUF2817 domain-containing protein [Pedobacter alpinus]|uniref:DUF2817 domain-containing protein n=1 Tax=Pedobacter alpinus TaxID=1590643 RepID=A0ABW5TSD9_9SPHI